MKKFNVSEYARTLTQKMVEPFRPFLFLLSGMCHMCRTSLAKVLSSVACAVSLRAVRRHADIDDAAAVCRSICALTKKVRLGTPGHIQQE